jgi:hypothetical protein
LKEKKALRPSALCAIGTVPHTNALMYEKQTARLTEIQEENVHKEEQGQADLKQSFGEGARAEKFPKERKARIQDDCDDSPSAAGIARITKEHA